MSTPHPVCPDCQLTIWPDFPHTCRAPCAWCGDSPGVRAAGLSPARVGCGGRLETCADVFRCVDCKVPFHQHCLERHCKSDLAAMQARAERAEADVTLAHQQVKFTLADRDKWMGRAETAEGRAAALEARLAEVRSDRDDWRERADERRERAENAEARLAEVAPVVTAVDALSGAPVDRWMDAARNVEAVYDVMLSAILAAQAKRKAQEGT